MPEKSNESEAIILVKASPQFSQKNGETVCCAGVDLHGNWLRLYPVSFRHLDQEQKFGRWDKVHFKWRLPKDDNRKESRRIDQQSLEITGKLPQSEKEKFLSPLIKTSLDKEYQESKSLALLQAEIIDFFYERKEDSEIEEELLLYKKAVDQSDLFAKKVLPKTPCPYKFKYRYRTDDGIRVGTCQDWEIEATYFNHKKRYDEKTSLDYIMNTFGKDYPEKGMLLAMGTHSRYPETWLINGIIRLNEIKQFSLDF